ncbi:MORF4L1 [Cordylochernes scorpioides]|uniref:MORF4L1 n=1 Tax=Cordylochernes scorpioides TaxID=51811 RepID=A0ABY6LVK5_9ARAC|nr:MORF4L1 [Cordylochernes scorpioides]
MPNASKSLTKSINRRNFKENEKVLCYRGPLLYEARCTKFQIKDKKPTYLIHYSGWNKNKDECVWVPEKRILKYNNENVEKQKELKAMRQKNNRIKHTQNKKEKPQNEDKSRRSITKSADQGQKKKKIKVDAHVESEESYLSKPEIKINIPEELKPWLIDDWDLITHKKKLFIVPAKMTVDQILQDFYNLRVAGKVSAAKQNLFKDVTNGIRDYFNVMLGTQLLYKFERQQYSVLMAKYGDRQPSQLYGGIHLLRLFAKMGSMLAYTAIDERGLISTLQLVKKLDRYPFRKKRKIDSVEQEETTMTIKKEATNQVGSFFIQHLPRNPSMFSGEGSEDPHNWLKKYERVAKHNQWDETLCLANVYFYLTGTALKWFENNEESILTWTEFMSQLKSVFGKNENLRLRAEKTLKTRAQLKGESTEFYIQDVLRLCKEVDPHMNEQDKISHLMKGIAEELYQALLPRDAHTTQQFVTECRRIEALHCKRVTPTRYERLPNVASLSDHDDRADLSSMIRQIVRE